MKAGNATGANKDAPQVRCEGSEYVWEYSSPWLVAGLPVCCPRCGSLVTLTTLVQPEGPNLPMSPIHDREA